MRGYRVFTHDLRPPVHGGDPVWDGSLPFVLPTVKVDRSDDECGAGWNFCRHAADALRIAGLWPDGRPSRLFIVSTAARARVEERKEKCRASSLTIEAEATASEVAAAVRDLSKVFGQYAEWMAGEQLAWREALGRPRDDAAAVEAGLREALRARGLGWELRRFDTARTAWTAWAAWDARDARAARTAWTAWAAWAARDAWTAWDVMAAMAARDAWDSRDAMAARTARDARDAWADARDAWTAWDARDAWTAWDALTLGFASRQGWVQYDALLLTRGLRDAYLNGLELAVPSTAGELGWSMAVRP